MKLYHTEKKACEKAYYLAHEHVTGLFAKLGKQDGDLLGALTGSSLVPMRRCARLTYVSDSTLSASPVVI